MTDLAGFPFGAKSHKFMLRVKMSARRLLSQEVASGGWIAENAPARVYKTGRFWTAAASGARRRFHTRAVSKIL